MNKRDLSLDILETDFKPITFTLFNDIDDDYYVTSLEIIDKTKYSIIDFEYVKVTLTDKEQFLIKMHNKAMLSNVSKLIKQFKTEPRIKIIVNFEKGEVYLIKLKNVKFNNI